VCQKKQVVCVTKRQKYTINDMRVTYDTPDCVYNEKLEK